MLIGSLHHVLLGRVHTAAQARDHLLRASDCCYTRFRLGVASSSVPPVLPPESAAHVYMYVCVSDAWKDGTLEEADLTALIGTMAFMLAHGVQEGPCDGYGVPCVASHSNCIKCTCTKEHL